MTFAPPPTQMKNSLSKKDLEVATREFIYVLSEMTPDQAISDMFDTEEIGSWLKNVVVNLGNPILIHEFSRAAIMSKKCNKYIIDTFIKSCQNLERLNDLKVLLALPSRA